MSAAAAGGNREGSDADSLKFEGWNNETQLTVTSHRSNSQLRFAVLLGSLTETVCIISISIASFETRTEGTTTDRHRAATNKHASVTS